MAASIENFAQTIAIGLWVVGGLWLSILLWIPTLRQPTPQVHPVLDGIVSSLRQFGGEGRGLHTTFALAAALTFGLAIESYSKDVVRSGGGWFLGIVPGISHLLPPEKELRRDMIATANGTPLAFAKELADDGAFVRFGGPHAFPLTRWAQTHGLCSPTNLTGAINVFYFRAKTIAFQTPDYYAELTWLESRVRFARSFTVACMLLILCNLTFLATRGVPWHQIWPSPIRKRVAHPSRPRPRRLPAIAGSLILIAVMLAGIAFGSFAYESEERSLIGRVYCYAAMSPERAE